jgi:hypothetical protein
MADKEGQVYQNPVSKKQNREIVDKPEYHNSITEVIDARLFRGAGASAIGERTVVPTDELERRDFGNDALRPFFK